MKATIREALSLARIRKEIEYRRRLRADVGVGCWKTSVIRPGSEGPRVNP